MATTAYNQVHEASREVGQGLHAIKSAYAADKPLWVYVLDGDFTLWVDVGINVTPSTSVIPYLTERAPGAWEKAQVAIITHADVDHFGGIGELRERRRDTIVMAHAADRNWIESPQAVLRERYLMHADDGIVTPQSRQDILLERGGGGGKVDIALQGDETLHLGAAGTWRVLHAPGHSRGHIVLWEERRHWAIIGDAALDWGVPNMQGALIAPSPYYDIETYRATIRMLLELEAETIFTSHFGILNANQGDALLSNSLAAVDRLEAALDDSLRQQPEGLLLAQLSIETGSRCADHWDASLWAGLADPLSAHLKRGLADGRLERVSNEGVVRYRRR